MATIKEVSRLAGVSNATVSRVLNGTVPVTPEVSARVLAAVKAARRSGSRERRRVPRRRWGTTEG